MISITLDAENEISKKIVKLPLNPRTNHSKLTWIVRNQNKGTVAGCGTYSRV